MPTAGPGGGGECAVTSAANASPVNPKADGPRLLQRFRSRFV